MAFAPCSVHKGGFKGGASTFFPALVRGNERISQRQKTCPPCGTTFHEWAVEKLSLVSEGETFFPQEKPTFCLNCRGELTEPWAFFLNEYRRGDPERQFYGQCCANCALAVAQDWHIDV